jgi:FlaA1/EpsC-like NDP-sugar epimerase
VVIIAVPSLPSVEIRRLAREAADAGAIVRYLPSNKRPTAEGPRMRDLRHLRLNLNSDERERVDASERAGAASIGRRRRDEDLLHPGRECSASLAPRVVLVGGAGFVGSVLARRLLDRRYRVTVVDALVYGDGGVRDLHAHPAFEVVKADLRDTDIISRSCRGAFAVVHLGGLVGDPACALDEQLTLDINLTATRTIAEAAREAGARRFVFASSCAVYGPATTF